MTGASFHDQSAPFNPDAARNAAAATAYPDSTNRTRDDWPTPIAGVPVTTRPVLIIQGTASKPIDMSWRTAEAACNGVGVDLFFSESLADTRQAQTICHTCPLIDACRDHAVLHERFGVWGGTSEKQRRALRRGLREAADVERYPMVHGTRAGYDRHRRHPDQFGPPCDACRQANYLASTQRRDPVKAEQKRRLRRLRAIEGGAA